MSEPAPHAAPPRLSVVVPTHGDRERTARCWRALDEACRRVHACERILVDDASDDDTAGAIAAAHRDVRIVRLAEPHGFTAAANAGLAVARGEIVWLLHADTEPAPDAAERLLAAFDANPWLGVAGAAPVAADGSARTSGGVVPGARVLLVLDAAVAALVGRVPCAQRARPATASAIEVDWVSGAALALRRETLLRTGLLDPALRVHGQDADLCLRARALGWQVMLVPGARVVHHEASAVARWSVAVAEGRHPEQPWADVVRLVVKHRGVAHARRVRAALVAGAALRVALRRAATRFVAAARRERWCRETDALVAGIAALRRLDLVARVADSG